MTTRPNWTNPAENCCACLGRRSTPKDHEKPSKDELHVWQPSPLDPPQWICFECKTRFEAEQRRPE